MTPTRASSKLAPCRRLPRAHGLDRAVWCSNLPASFATFFWAVLRPRIGGSRLRRAALAFLLVDETFGFAVAAGDSADRDGRPGDHSGRACYLAWQVGTLIGVLGAGLPGIEGVTSAIFPVLFIGLASLACRTRSHVLRALGAAALTVGWPFALPNLRALPVVAGVVVALPGEVTGDFRCSSWWL
jgi:predicted branched-subunit amino acid permease